MDETKAFDNFVKATMKPIRIQVENCKTCAHRSGSGLVWSECLRTGRFISTQRQYPDKRCDSNFSGWQKSNAPWWKFWAR